MFIQTYYQNLAEAYNPDLDSELTYRSRLETLLYDLLKSLSLDSELEIIHEGQRIQGGFGTPDFRILEKTTQAAIGYLENKALGSNLDQVLKSGQIRKYCILSNNVLVTDYLEFILLEDGQVAHRCQLAQLKNLSDTKFKPGPESVSELEALLTRFVRKQPEPITDVKSMAEALARRAQLLHTMLQTDLEEQLLGIIPQGKLAGLYNTFRQNISSELSVPEFADAFAQTLAYGLFLARLNLDGKAQVTLTNAEEQIPQSMELIRELVEFLNELAKPRYKENARWIVNEILVILNRLDLPSIQKALSYKQQKARAAEGFSEPDPYLYFYEDFLAAYNPQLRKAKGVYYTPPAIVNFIVRCMDNILKQKFAIPEGLADRNRVTVLDFATGTGTFLFETMRHILENVGEAKKLAYIKEHILKNLFGFEYLIAPYTIAHLKLGQYLKEEGYIIGEKDFTERLGVYLTNTLEPLQTQMNAFVPALSREGAEAQKIKQKPILVITGNPPYNGHSSNNGPWIKNQIAAYKLVNGKPMQERNLKWLQNDYVKFIRFAQDKMDKVKEGIVGIITDHSFLDGPTFRGMRWSLMQTFDQIYVLDLHGNSKRKESHPDGGKDVNVFNIIEGVCISLFIKRPGLENGVFRSDFWGDRESKFQQAEASDFDSVPWKPVRLSEPNYLFTDQNNPHRTEYEQGLALDEIFVQFSVGLVTARDGLCIQPTPEKALSVAKDFARLDPEKAREKYNLGSDSQDWKVILAQADLNENGLTEEAITRIHYRPFDFRFTFYTGKSSGFHCRPRRKIMQNMLQPNMGLAVGRAGQNVGKGPWNLVFISNTIIDLNLFYRGGEQLYPLYIYHQSEGMMDNGSTRTENFTPAFRQKMNSLYGNPSPEQLLGYMYAVLHSPSFRHKYDEFLISAFPRIPFTNNKPEFERLALLGQKLYAVHLMEQNPSAKYKNLGNFAVAGNNEVTNPDFIQEPGKPGKLIINPDQYFEDVPANVYDFYIGGYPILPKYLKDRKDCILSLDEIETVEKMVKIIAFTLDMMQEIG